jgi:hypothetical protein
MYMKIADRMKSLGSRSLNKNYMPQRARELVQIFRVCKTAKEREMVAYHFINALCRHFKLPHCRVKFHDKKRRTCRGPKVNGEFRKLYLCGLYTYWHDNDPEPLIEIWNLSETGRKLPWFILLDTLRHEFCHHYDAYKLKIALGHDEGFHDRLRHLRKLTTKRKRRKGNTVEKYQNRRKKQ